MFFIRDTIFLLLVVLYQLFLILYVQKIDIYCSAGFLVLYAIFVVVVIITNKIEGNQENSIDEQQKANMFLEVAH